MALQLPGFFRVVINLWLKINNRARRDASRVFERRLAPLELSEPMVSFTFDDFPRSALHQGGAILNRHGFLGTYYASFGLMGQIAPTGEMFSEADLPEFVRQRHELACHTFDHCHAWDTNPAEFEASILRNQQTVARLLPGVRMTSFSYPISCPRPAAKRKTARHYNCARGAGQTFNTGMMDMNYLKAFFIEQSRDNLDAIKEVIDANVRANGWLIFATHDVCKSPTRFGCIPHLFEDIVAYVAKSDSVVLPVNQVCQKILSQSSGLVHA